MKTLDALASILFFILGLVIITVAGVVMASILFVGILFDVIGCIASSLAYGFSRIASMAAWIGRRVG